MYGSLPSAMPSCSNMAEQRLPDSADDQRSNRSRHRKRSNSRTGRGKVVAEDEWNPFYSEEDLLGTVEKVGRPSSAQPLLLACIV